jgi:uncharacterized protein
VALFSFVAVVTMGSFSVDAKVRKDRLTLVTSTGQHVIEIEVAESNEDQQLGLMFRPAIPQNTGMLFPYGEPRELTMWMRNTYASLDMIFINRDGLVHRIEEGTEPMSEKIIGSNGPVSAVLELAAGEAKRLGLKPGDSVQHSSFKPTKR